MNQTRIGSAIEVAANIVIGYTINFTANFFIFPMFGYEITMAQNFKLGIIYTVIAVVRSYAIRRWFNAKLHAASLKLAEMIA